MHRLGFKLQTSAAVEGFKSALQSLSHLRKHGWRLVGAEEGYSGGLPAGRLELVHGGARETIPFPLDAASLQEFRAAHGKVEELPAGLWTVTGVELELTDGQPSGVIILETTRAVRQTAPSRAVDEKRALSAAVKVRSSSGQQPSIYDLKEDAAVTALRDGTGEHADELRALLGDDYFNLLTDLARRSPAKRASRGKAFVLPGIMGSKLGTRKKFIGLVDYSDVIWLDPVDMRLGRMDDLVLTGDGKAQNGTQSVGVLYSFYLRLKLNLQFAGFDTEFYDYDWRRPVRDLGEEFKRVLNQQKGPVVVVAHSMGGVVTRAALKAGAKNVGKLVMIGTPNHGSFVPAQAMRAAYPFLKSLATVFDRDLVSVTDEIFATFGGLYDLLAAASKFPNFELFNPAKWPKSPPHFRPDLLKAAARAQDLLAPPDDRFHLICGVNQDTVVDVRMEDDEFIFLQSKDGDGTVPRISAELPGCEDRTYYVEGSHGMLPNYSIVCDLAVDLALNGKTSIETLDWQPPTVPPTEIKESALRSAPLEIRGLKRGEEPSPSVVRQMIEPLLGLPPVGAEVVTPGAVPGTPPPPAPGTGGALFAHELKGVIIGRRRQRQLEVAFVANSLTAVPSRAYVLGLFQGVAPAGAAMAVDELMDGMITDFVRRRMLNGRLGEIFIVPKGRSMVAADHIVFVGLGPFDRFKQIQDREAGGRDAMRLICESVVRTCLHANIEEFTTVLLGASAAESTGDAVRLFTRSFVEALEAADIHRRLRRITLCETDPQRIVELRTELLRLATTDLFDDVELELRDVPQPAVIALPAAAVARGAVTARRGAPLYLLARMIDPSLTAAEESQRRAPVRHAGTSPKASGPIILEMSLLTPQSKAAVLTARCERSVAEKQKLLAPIGRDDFSEAALKQLGSELAAFVFDEPMRQALQRLANDVRELPLVVVHDSVASQLPWEAFRFGDWSPALTGGVIRQHLDANYSVAKWLEQRAEDVFLDVLLVTNPTGDLPGAEAEGDAVRDVLNKVANVRLTERRRSQATRTQLLADFRSGQFDVIHYAGHAFFNPTHSGRTGVICAGREVLSGSDLAGLASLPSLVFFNACESARIRGRRAGEISGTKKGERERAERNLSLANSFIRGGVANFLGTYWPVGDYAAKKFSETFYPLLVGGKTVGDAVLAGRRAVEQSGSVDWADYILYGSPDFVLKRPTA